MDSNEKHRVGLFATPSFVVGDDDPTCLRLSRSASSAGSSCMEAYMQSLLQQQQHHKGGSSMSSSMNTTLSPQLPPSASMSLRARETASMSLKHIFDQQMSNGSSSREQDCNSMQGQQMGGFQGMRNKSMPDLRRRVPELDLGFRKAQDNDFANAQTGFGSPISTPTNTNQGELSQASLPMNSTQLVQHAHMPQAMASQARLSPSTRQPTAQMTVFYSGSVNVYNDVPADRAHAIMLLAGNSRPTSFRCPAGPARAAPSASTEVIAKESPMKAGLEAPPLVTETNANGGGIARNVWNPASASPAISSVASPPSPAPVLLADGPSNAHAGTRRPPAGIELPHARKASLARFLSKRKGRAVQIQEGGDGGEKPERDDEELSGSCGDKHHDHPATSGKKSRMRSRSPSPSRGINDGDATTKSKGVDDEEGPLQGGGILNEHCFFH